MGAVGARFLKFAHRFAAYTIHLVELKLGRMVLDINLHNRYEQDFSGAGEGLRIPNSFCRRHLYMFPCLPIAEICLLDLRDDRSVRSALFSGQGQLFFPQASKLYSEGDHLIKQDSMSFRPSTLFTSDLDETWYLIRGR